MAASDVGSWLDVNPGTDTASCCSRLKICGAKALAWWRDTTDPVVLNSPWLRRGTGRFFRALSTLGQFCAWLSLLLPDLAVRWATAFPETLKGSMNKDIPLFVLMAVCLAFSLGTSLWTSRESFRGSMFFGIGSALSFRLLSVRALYFTQEFSFSFVIAVICHCNVHPAVLFLVVFYHLLCTPWDDLMQDEELLVTFMSVITFECTMLVAFTWDFTLRVKAVCSGVLFGENDEVLKSPVAGRSARSVCWVSGVNQWILWAATMIHHHVEYTRQDAAFLRNHIPISSIADFAMAFFCCAPAVLLMVNFRFAYVDGERMPLIWYYFRDETIRRSLLLFTTAVQTLIQAGCHPMICAAATASLTAASFLTWPFEFVEEVHTLGNRGSFIVLSPVVIVTALAWFLVVSHMIDFFARMRAIERGMQQSHQNAASSQRLLASERDGVELPAINEEVMRCDNPSLELLAAPSGPSKRGPSAVVAVVRHAERADNMQTFDTWGCSKDAESFPHDPPITARGAEQAEQQLADELKMKEMDFEVIVSSPFLRCLQTALILAEKFDAKVLIDQELGEVMGPPVFETKPPLPPRPWSNLKATLKASAISADSHERLRAGRLMGKGPEWKESLQQARLRYVKRYLDYLRRARHTKKSCMLVTHGHMVQACASVLPVNQHRKIISVDYCGAAVAECHRLGKDHRHEAFLPARAVSFDSGKHQAEKEDVQNVQNQFDEKNELIQDAKMRYWTLWLRGVRTVPAETPSNGSHLSGLSALGQSWQDLVKLLGVLPPVAPATSDSHSESACSFGTRTNTTVSMNMIREPDSTPKSPRENEPHCGHCVTVQKTEVTQNKQPSVAPKLKPLMSGLAARRGFNKSKVPATVVEDQV
eukprot:s893_g28.t1